jgi:hypothetical protein
MKWIPACAGMTTCVLDLVPVASRPLEKFSQNLQQVEAAVRLALVRAGIGLSFKHLAGEACKSAETCKKFW